LQSHAISRLTSEVYDATSSLLTQNDTMTILPAARATASSGSSAWARMWTLYRTWFVAAALGMSTVGLFWPATHYAFIDFDDDRYVTANVMAQHGLTWETLKFEMLNPICANWHPVTMLSHVLDCQFYGLNPWGHHLTSLLFHAANTVLVFLFLRRLTGTFWRSACVAALFAWHPLHVESVAWIAERKDVLSTFFGLLSLLAYVRYARRSSEISSRPDVPPPPFYRSPSYWLAWFWLMLGLLSKPMLVTWPFVFLLLDYWPLQRLQTGRLRPLVVEKFPFLILTALICAATFLVHKVTGDMKALEGLPVGPRFENALISYCRYLFKTIWPSDLAVFYPHPGHWPMGCVALAGAFLIAITALVWTARRGRFYLPLGWFWFLGMLVPVIGLVQVGRLAMADRYTYVPSVGLFMIVVWGIYDLTRRWRRQALVLSLAASAALFSCCVLTRHQLGYWQDSETLFRHALAVTDDNELARNNLGVALLARGQTEAGIDLIRQAIRLRPNSPMPYNNLGKALLDKGDVDSAIDNFRKAIQIEPELSVAHYNLAGALAAKGRTNEAIDHLVTAVRVQPDYFEAHNNLAIFLSTQGRTNEAIGEFKEAVWLKPDYAEAHFNFGNLLAQIGRADDAIGQFGDAARLRPKDAEIRLNLAGLLAKIGQAEPAIAQYQAALSLNPTNAEAAYKLGNLLARAGRADEAIRRFQDAVRLQPDFAEAHNNLGSLFSAHGSGPDAIVQFQAAIRARPDYMDAHYNLANAFLKSGQIDDAIGQFQTVVELAPAFAPAHYYLGLALAKSGRSDDAIAQFQEAIRLKPGNTEASNHLARLLELKGDPAKH
jgi:tetratricopeptide (TPR) repeat protein